MAVTTDLSDRVMAHESPNVVAVIVPVMTTGRVTSWDSFGKSLGSTSATAAFVGVVPHPLPIVRVPENWVVPEHESKGLENDHE